MIRLLFLIFKKRFLQLAFNSQSKKIGLENMQQVFIDSNGARYFSLPDDLDLPIARGKEVQKRIQLIQASMSEPNLRLFLEAMKKALGDGKKPDVAVIGFLVIELEKRLGIYVDMDLLFDTVALAYIREDEKVEIIDSVIHKEKIEQFKKDSQGGLYDFFYSAGLIGFIPYAAKSPEEWSEFFEKSELKMKSIQRFLNHYITESN